MLIMILLGGQRLQAEDLMRLFSLNASKHIANYNSIKDELTDSSALIYINGLDTVHAPNNRNKYFYIATIGVKKTNFYIKYLCFPDGFIIPVAAGYGSSLKVDENAFGILCNAKKLKGYFNSENDFYSFWADLVIPSDYRIYSFYSQSFLKSAKQDELKKEYSEEIRNGASLKQKNGFMILIKDYKYITRQPLFLLYFYDNCHYKFAIDHKIGDLNKFIGSYDAQMGPLIVWKW